MIIGDFNICAIATAPEKANAPLRIDANAMLPFAAAFQCDSRRLPGGTNKSASVAALFSILNLRLAMACISSGNRRAGVPPHQRRVFIAKIKNHAPTVKCGAMVLKRLKHAHRLPSNQW